MWNPPALTTTEEWQDKDSVTTKPSGADDGGPSHGTNSFGAHFMFSPFNAVGIADVPRPDIQGDRLNNKLCLDLNCLTDSKTDANLMDAKNDKSEPNRESEMSSPEVIMREFYNVTDKSNTVTADCSIDNWKPEACKDFMQPWCESASGYPIKAHGAEAKNSRISKLSMSSSSGTSVLSLVGNFGVTGNNNDVNTVPCPYSSPPNVDGNFLSLGIGGGIEIKSNSNFSAREIASKLADPVSSQYNNPIVGQSPTNPWTFTPLTGVQTNAGGLSSSALAGSSRLNPIQFPGLQTPQANPQSSLSAMYTNFVFDGAPSLSHYGIPITPQSGHVTQSPLGTQISRSPSFASQVIPRQQQYSRRSSMNASSESSISYFSDRLRGSSVSHAQLGRLIPMTESRITPSIAGVCFPGNVQTVGNLTSQAESTSKGVANIFPSPSSVQPVESVRSDTSHNLGSVAALGNSLFPDRIGSPVPRVVPRVSNIQSAGAGPFPRRLGVQPNEPTVRTIRGTTIRLPAQAYPVRSLLPSGQHHHGMLTHLPTDFPRVDYSSDIHLPAQAYPVRPLVSSGQVTPVARLGGVRPQGSPFVSHPHLKRRATVNPSTAQLSQRRKISPQPVVMNHSVPGQRPSFPAIPARSHIPPTPLHIKWRGFDEPLEPSGQKCHLCKRGISFTAEGPMYQPAILPAAAVLPCGHTFHDDCLQRITPEGYTKNPPCIPCALGET